MAKKYISSEEYRQMLVRDADCRFAEWHSNFLNYQKKFLAEMSLLRYLQASKCVRETSSSQETPEQVPKRQKSSFFPVRHRHVSCD
ncbi:MAG: hypothetical protein GDA48_17030 [Hormoscilla sp. GM102CHS1]|nr:hypothetical protein [Hormoscilla sp. GM102CHS1]